MNRVGIATAILAVVGLVLGTVPAKASGETIPVYAETAADALSRNVRILADRPRDLNALLAAGKAALDLGDEQAAAGFFGRAQEVSPNSPLAQAGMAAALVASGDARGSLAYFARAQQLGASLATFGCDRGLAFDLLGNQGAAQADYRAALFGPDRDEAQRRLALSQAIAGNKDAAMATLQPLLQRGDAGARRVRALVLALGGDLVGAKAQLDMVMPGAGHRMDPFFRQLPSLRADQKAAAVHLGLFPSSSGSALASASDGDRLASIEQILTQSQPQPQQVQPAQPASVPAPQPRYAVTTPAPAPVRQATVSAATETRSRVWLQLASGKNEGAFADQFRRIKRSTDDLLNDIDGYVAEDRDRYRLVIGPFKSTRDASIFADDLATLRVDAFSWTSTPGQTIRKLPLE